jgi:hypothetical protein
MPFPPTPSQTPSNTPTPSITASQTPSYTPTGTVCPGLTPTATRTPTQTQTQTGTIPVTPTQTQTQTATIAETPTMTPTPSTTPEIFECVCFSTTYEEIPEGLQVRWRDCETETILTQDISSLLQRDNLDGTYTSFICVKQGLSYETPVCVLGGIEVTCDPLIWIEGGVCSDSIDCDIDPFDCVTYQIDNTGQPFEIEWSGLQCITQSPIGGTIAANTSLNTGCVIEGTLSTTGSPIISIVAIC